MATPDPALAIQVRALTKNFGGVCALDGVDLEVPRGTVLGLLGPNGAGKTTTVNILATALQPDGGDAHVLGIDVARDPAKVRGVIGLAGQYAAVDGTLTGRENLALIGTLTHLPRRLIRRRADELLERFDLTDAGDRLARTYSGGMRRRLDLAAALVHQPPVLFLDEPTTGLDPASRNDLWQTVRELVDEGTTVLLTTQYLEEADQLAHRIAVVDHGRVMTEGTAVELKRRLGATVVELVFADASVASGARTTLEPLGLGPVTMDGAAVHIAVAEGPRALMTALRALDVAGVEPTAAAVREPSLDDVFLTLTGTRTEGSAQDPPAAARRRDGGLDETEVEAEVTA